MHDIFWNLFKLVSLWKTLKMGRLIVQILYSITTNLWAITLSSTRVSVRVFSSERAGSGKTLAVHRLHQNVRQLTNNDVVIRYLEDTDTDVQLCIAIPIYGPEVKQCSVVESFLPHMVAPDLPLSRIFHLDVHPSVGSTQYLHVLSRIITKLCPLPHPITINANSICGRCS